MSLFFKIKQSKTDFTENDLPSNRKEVFFDALKIRFHMFIKIGLVMLAFSLPLIIVGLMKDSYLYSLQAAFEQGEIVAEDFKGYETVLLLIYNVILIPCFILFGVGLAGALRVIRQIAWSEPLFFGQDFFAGIKLQGGRYALYFFFAGLLNLLSEAVMRLGVEIELLRYVPLAFNLVFFLPALLYAVVESQIYRLKPFEEYKNGVILYIRTMPKTVLATIVVCLPLLFDLIGNVALKYLAVCIYIVVILPFVCFGEFLYLTSNLDRFVNKEHYPTIYDKGIHRKTE